jgi:hypothetical protein
MAIISQGILGGISGKIGNVVGGSWKGIDYLRIMPASVANPKTPAQMDQRSKFVTVIKFLQPMVEFLRVGFKLYAIKMTQFNNAMSYNLKNAITGSYPDYVIDYSKALISRGSLAGAYEASIASVSATEMTLSWTDNTGKGKARARDKSLLLAYDTSTGTVVYNTAGAERSIGAESLTVPAELSGGTFETFLGFISEDGTLVSNSVYVGSITLI